MWLKQQNYLNSTQNTLVTKKSCIHRPEMNDIVLNEFLKVQCVRSESMTTF